MNVDANKNELKSSRMVSSCLQPPKTLWPAALRIQGQSLVFFKFHHWSQYFNYDTALGFSFRWLGDRRLLPLIAVSYG